MADQEVRERVVKGLECCTAEGYDCIRSGCPYHDDYPARCRYDLMCNALALLKEQEPVIPKRFEVSWFCGNCKTKLVFTRSNKAAYCWRCGKAVKWE